MVSEPCEAPGYSSQRRRRDTAVSCGQGSEAARNQGRPGGVGKPQAKVQKEPMPVMQEEWMATAMIFRGVITLSGHGKEGRASSGEEVRHTHSNSAPHRRETRSAQTRSAASRFLSTGSARQPLQPIRLPCPIQPCVPPHVSYQRNPALARIPERVPPHLQRSRRHRYVGGKAQAVQVGPIARLDGHTKCV